MTYYSATIIKRVSERLLIIYSADFFQVISASSDGTVKAWNPHATTLGDASTIGTHSDYVRCLVHWYVVFFCFFVLTVPVDDPIAFQLRAKLDCIRIFRQNDKIMGSQFHY